jgi:hypothetical protein
MQLQFLITSEQRASGAMFMESLNNAVLAFIYPTDGPRTFHTFFCPPMRIIALSAEGQTVFDEVITKWRWVKLPVCRYVIETGPEVDYCPYVKTVLSVAPDLPQQGTVDRSVGMDNLLRDLLAEAVGNIRRIREAHTGEVKLETQREKFEVWERGQIVSSAGFLLDFSQAWNLPEGAVKCSYSVLKAEEPYLDEIIAASIAGIPFSIPRQPCPWNFCGVTSAQRTPFPSAIIAPRP